MKVLEGVCGTPSVRLCFSLRPPLCREAARGLQEGCSGRPGAAWSAFQGTGSITCSLHLPAFAFQGWDREWGGATAHLYCGCPSSSVSCENIPLPSLFLSLSPSLSLPPVLHNFLHHQGSLLVYSVAIINNWSLYFLIAFMGRRPCEVLLSLVFTMTWGWREIMLPEAEQWVIGGGGLPNGVTGHEGIE